MERLILIHGFTGAPESWLPVLQAGPGLEGRATALALPGHAGRPPVACWEEAIETLGREVAADGEALVHLVGYSMGARAALGLLLRYPQRFARATLIGVHPGLPPGPERWARLQWDHRWIRILRREGLEAFLQLWEALPLFETQREATSELLRLQRAVRRRQDPDGLASALEAMGLSAMPYMRPELTSIDVPVRLVVGARDKKFVEVATELVGCFPRGELCVLPAVGHNPIVEAPGALARVLEMRAWKEDAA